ncbi:MAG: carbamoyltransferase [Deltaproteobacteria bacterium]|nr:carbamoyltransferase [Deltaproteobacteria bacterium]
MNILGINDNHDSSAALVIDGELVAAVGQERVDRDKNSGAFPWDAITDVLYHANLEPKDIDRIVFGSHFTPATALRRFSGLHHGTKATTSQYSPLLNAYITYQVAVKESGAWPMEADISRRLLQRRMRDRGFGAPVTTLEHHSAHAYSAYRSQPHLDALAFTIDAMGDGTSCTVSEGHGGDLKLIHRQSGFASINTYYSRITEYLGFRANRHEGKITGLAAYKEAPPELLAHFAKQFHFEEKRGGFNLTNYFRRQSKTDRFHRFLETFDREQIAAALQRNLETQVVAFVRHWVRKTGRGHIALAGGTCANVKLNQRIHEIPEVKSLFVYPNMGDGGLAAGAALAMSAVVCHELKDSYMGRDFSEAEYERALERTGLPYTRPADLAGEVADKLVDNKVVARCAGRMEWGPRALGNRTVMFRPDVPEVNDWLNTKLQRTEFMPFAPVTLWEKREDCYLGLEGAESAARFMTVCFDCTDRMKKESPGVVHIDGTARPQLIRREDNADYYDIVAAFHERTGNPSVINTSFNMHEEPIVRSPRDAVRAFVASGIDHLVLGPFLVSQKPA